MHTAKISPSMMCCDIVSTLENLQIMESCGIELLHMDIMDGRFVPNYALGTDYCRQIRRYSQIPLDIHLMIEHPESKLDWFPLAPGDIVSVHAETTCHLQRVLSAIRAKGARPFAVLNPATPPEQLRYVLDDLDGVLVMSVNPGFAGQKLVPAALEKICHLRTWLDTHGYAQIRIEVDGNVSVENAAKMRAAGADIFVAGTASIFRDGRVSAERILQLRDAIRAGE